MAEKIKLLSVGHSYVVGLNRSILREIAKDEEFEVTVGAPKVFHGSLRSITCEPEPSGSKLTVHPLSAYWTQKMHIFSYDHFELRKLMEQGFHGLHIWEEPYIFAGFQVSRLAHKQQIPFCIRTAQSLIKKYPWPFRSFEKKVFGWANRWIAGGHLVFNSMSEKGWNDRQQGQVLTLAVDTERFRPFSDIDKVRVKKELNLDGPVIGYLGRLSEEKGCDLIMEVLTRMKHKSWSLLMMGSGPYEERLKEWSHREGLADRVSIQLYPHGEIPEVLPICDILICPSQTRPFWKEQFGRMIVEAFACGVPVLGSDSGEIPRVIGDAGRVVGESDNQGWYEQLSKLLDSSKERDELRRLGLQRAPQFSAAKLAEDYKAFYRSMME